MKVVILHGWTSNEPIAIRLEAIDVLRKFFNVGDKEEYTEVTVGTSSFIVKEKFREVLLEIQRA